MKLQLNRSDDRGSVQRWRARKRRFYLLFSILMMAAVVAPSPRARAGDTNDVNREERPRRKVFSFEGGNPFDLIAALDRHFRTRLVQVLTLPETLSRTKVPKLRVAAEDPREVLAVYNRLQSPTLGQWRYEPEVTAQKGTGTDTNVNVLMLDPDKSVAAGKLEQHVTRIKGVALAGVPEAKWEALMRDIDLARTHGDDVAAKSSGEVFVGSVRIQRDSKVLIVAGSPAYLDMVDSLVSAHRTNAEIETRTRAEAKTDSSVR